MTVPWKSWALPGLPRIVLLTEPLPLVLSTKAELAVVAQGDGRGEVAGVAEAADRPGVEVDLGDGVVAAVGDVEGLAPDGQGVGHAAEHPERSPAQGDGPR